MPNDSLNQRRQALEDAYFAGMDRKLLERMREHLSSEKSREELSQLLHIDDVATLDHLLAQNITARTLGALALVPLVEIAWADGHVHEEERQAILDSARKEGMNPDAPSYALLSAWLEKWPGPGLMQAWKEYIAALRKVLDEEAVEALRSIVIERVEHVARAAGGILGLGNKISRAEKVVLDELKAVFNGG